MVLTCLFWPQRDWHRFHAFISRKCYDSGLRSQGLQWLNTNFLILDWLRYLLYFTQLTYSPGVPLNSRVISSLYNKAARFQIYTYSCFFSLDMIHVLKYLLCYVLTCLFLRISAANFTNCNLLNLLAKTLLVSIIYTSVYTFTYTLLFLLRRNFQRLENYSKNYAALSRVMFWDVTQGWMHLIFPLLCETLTSCDGDHGLLFVNPWNNKPVVVRIFVLAAAIARATGTRRLYTQGLLSIQDIFLGQTEIYHGFRKGMKGQFRKSEVI